MNTSDLIEARGAIVARMETAHTADDAAAFETAETELRALDAKLDRQRKIDAADRAETGRTLTGNGGEEYAELRRQTVCETMAYKIDPASLPAETRAKVEREQAMLAERAGTKPKGVFIGTELFEQRATMTTGTAGTIAPTDFRPELFVSALTSSTILSRVGATTLTGLSGDVVIPRETGSPAVGWVNEDQALPTGSATFDQLSLTPHHFGVITELSRQLIMQSSPRVEQLIRSMLARNIALEIDRAGIAGTGTGAEPRGLLNDPDVPDVAWDSDLLNTSANMIVAADLANVGDTRAFVTTNGVRGIVMTTLDGDGHPVPASKLFHGETAYFSNQVPGTLGDGNDQGMVYGDFRDFLIGIWSELDVLVNPYAETAYRKGNVLVRAMATVDFGVRRPASFAKTEVPVA